LARATTETLVTQSILDRLMEVEEWPSTRSQSTRFFRDSLKRDLEWLLNTRQPPDMQIGSYPGAKASVINFGLPDISALGLSNTSDHRTLRIAIETCLRNYEPRLMDVRVTIEGSDTVDRRLRFHIEGNMKLDPAPEEISFDTVLELTSGEYKVK
jgi:type VI secretion system protein ImpF